MATQSDEQTVTQGEAQQSPNGNGNGNGHAADNSRIHLGDPILTNMPLIPDKPLDIGVEDFCRVCRKCATTCPTNSISMEGKVVHNGVEKYKINWETCYRLRAYVLDLWELCLRGGLPVLDSPNVVGAVGVSGGTGEQDLERCRAAVAAY
jgi:ferredoxin